MIQPYQKNFYPYAAAALLIGLVGGFSSVLGPAFVQDLNLPYQNVTWTALAQAMSTAACAPILGKIGDRIGQKVTLLLGIAIFTIGNIFSAVAPALWFMLPARFLVGIGTAAVTPTIIAYIATHFPTNKISKGYSQYMLISSGAVVFGPTLGSLIVSAWGWRCMQWICVGICIGIFLLCLLTGEKATFQRKPTENFDTFGGITMILFFSLILCIPSFGQNFGWTSPNFIFVMIAGVLSLALLVYTETRAQKPILPGKFVLRKTFILSILSLFLTQGFLQANMTNCIVFVNHTQPENTAISGYAISVMYLGMALGAIVLGPLADRLEPKYVLTGSFLLTGIGCGLGYFFSSNTPLALLMASLGILGIGLGGNGTILMKVALSHLPPNDAGGATGAYGLFRDLAAPFGTAIFVPLFTNRITAHTTAGLSQSNAAVKAIHLLSLIEVLFVAIGIILLTFLPTIHHKGETPCD